MCEGTGHKFSKIIHLFRFDIDQAFLLTTSSVVTASLASFTLGVIMILVVIGMEQRFSI